MKITSTSITPLIDVIPNFIVAERMTNLFEVQIDNAHIVVTTIDITNHLYWNLNKLNIRT